MSITPATTHDPEHQPGPRKEEQGAFVDPRWDRQGRVADAHQQRRNALADLREDGQGAFELLALARPVRRWFERREVVLGAAVCLTLVTFVLRELASSRDEILGLLYVVPVALVGLELGLRAGVAAALGALLLVAVRPPSSDPAVYALGLAMRGIALLSVGAIAGRFSDRMRAAQAHLQDHFRSAGHILGVHERERRGIAEQLHEQAAQAMAAALLLVRCLESQAPDRLAETQVQEVRDCVCDCIAHLRTLAATLRPPVLDELGLVPALERIVESRGGHDRLLIALRPEGLPGRLPPDTETLAYRAIEEVVECLSGTITLGIALGPRGVLHIKIEGESGERLAPDELDAMLATTRARLKIIGGVMSSSHAGVRMTVLAQIPVTAPTA